MLSVPNTRRAPSARSSRAPARRQAAKAGAGRRSVALILTGLVLLAVPMLTADASASTSAGPRTRARDAGTHASKTDTASTRSDAASTSPDPASASTDQAVDPGQARNGGNNGSHVTPGPPAAHTGPSSSGNLAPSGGSSSQGHHGSRGGSRHRSTHAGPNATRGPSGTTGQGVPVVPAIGRINPPAADVRDEADGGRERPHAIVLPHSARDRGTDDFGVLGSVEQVAGALRFPASLLGVILLFLALQQRADRRDPKLAKAPIAAHQETLEFR